MRLFWTRVLGCLTLLFLTVRTPAEDFITTLEYIEALRNAGYPDLAVDYIDFTNKRAKLTDDQKISLEFETAITLIASSEAENDLGNKQKRLDEARKSFEDFARKYPTHPRRPESLVQLATIDLQVGRLRVIEAQLPANESRSAELVEQARKLFAKASVDYDEAQNQIQAALNQMPAFIDPREEREQYKLRDRLFGQQIEAKFQAGLATFLLADSYQNVDYRGQDVTGVGEYRDSLQKALKVFEAIYNDHRRELVGLYGHLWMARCLAGLGEHDRAMGIYDLLMEHENRDLEPFQREVFHFRMLSMAGQGKFKEMTILGQEWLRKNVRYRMEYAYQGAQLAIARAYVAVGQTSKEPREKSKAFREADDILEALARYPNPFTGLARRDQLDLAKITERDVEGNTFRELVTLANARLDEVKDDMPPEKKAEIYADVEAKFSTALRAVRPSDDPEEVGSARLSLAYVYLQRDNYLATAVLGEATARTMPKFSQASEAAMYALSAYARLYDDSRRLAEAGQPADLAIDQNYMIRMADYLIQNWPRTSQADEARIILGKLYYTQGEYVKAAGILDAVEPRSVLSVSAKSLSGGCYWEGYKVEARSERPDKQKMEDFQAKALERLAEASAVLGKGDPSDINRERFLNDTILAEAYYEGNDDAKTLSTLKPLVDFLLAGNVSEQIEPTLRIAALVTSLQAYVRSEKIEETDSLIQLLSEQKGADASSNVTAVFISLARRLREQLERLRNGNQSDKANQMAASFEGFLDRVASRESGQTFNSLVYLGDTYLEIDKFDKANNLIQKALALPEAQSPEYRGSMARARLLLAKSLSRQGKHDESIKTVTDLLREMPNNKDVIIARGDLMETANRYPDAAKHWQWYIERLKRVEPRPVELYEGTERLIDCYLKYGETKSNDEKKKSLIAAYRLPAYLLETDLNMPAEWRAKFEKKAAMIREKIGQL